MAADPSYASWPDRHYSFVRRGQYADRLELFFELLGRDNVHVLFSERFSETRSRSTTGCSTSSACRRTGRAPASGGGTRHRRRR